MISWCHVQSLVLDDLQCNLGNEKAWFWLVLLQGIANKRLVSSFCFESSSNIDFDLPLFQGFFQFWVCRFCSPSGIFLISMACVYIREWIRLITWALIHENWRIEMWFWSPLSSCHICIKSEIFCKFWLGTNLIECYMIFSSCNDHKNLIPSIFRFYLD